MPIDLKPIFELDLGQKIGQLRAQPINLGPGAAPAFFAAYCADFDVDPYVEMFFFPSDTLKLAVIDAAGKVLWKKDLGRGVVPGMWFCPFFAMDFDGDGVDEIYFVNNTDPNHPLGVSNYKLERLDAGNGKTTGQWAWPCHRPNQSLSHLFRNFILGGRVKGRPVLVTAQGTYEDMFLQGWNPGMSPRWSSEIPVSAPGARGSHRCPIVDIDGDGSDEFTWGERVLRFDTGKEMFCCDRDTYRGHSDVADPVFDPKSKRWFIYTCRESDDRGAPRVALFDDTGKRVWGALEKGHIDMGWAARLGDNYEYVSMAIKIGHKTCGPDGRFHQDMEEFTFETFSGRQIKLPFSIYRTVPVDLDGDGRHELVRGIASGNGEVIDRKGRPIGDVKGPVALASKFLALPGEQLLAYYPDGKLRVWADRNANDTPEAALRYEHPFYRANNRLTATGYNLGAVAGI